MADAKNERGFDFDDDIFNDPEFPPLDELLEAHSQFPFDRDNRVDLGLRLTGGDTRPPQSDGNLSQEECQFLETAGNIVKSQSSVDPTSVLPTDLPDPSALVDQHGSADMDLDLQAYPYGPPVNADEAAVPEGEVAKQEPAWLEEYDDALVSMFRGLVEWEPDQ